MEEEFLTRLINQTDDFDDGTLGDDDTDEGVEETEDDAADEGDDGTVEAEEEE